MFTIGDAAREVDVPTHVLRHWEDMRVLAPVRDPAGRRLFDAEQVLRARLVLTCQALGLSLSEIRHLFLTDDPAVQLAQIQLHRQRLEDQRQRLAKLSGFLDHILVCPHTSLTDCDTCTAILESRPEIGGAPPSWHKDDLPEPFSEHNLT